MKTFIGTYFIGYLVFWLLIFAGWCMNVFKIYDLKSVEMTGELIIRVIGIFVPPLGGIVGWF